MWNKRKTSRWKGETTLICSLFYLKLQIKQFKTKNGQNFYVFLIHSLNFKPFLKLTSPWQSTRRFDLNISDIPQKHCSRERKTYHWKASRRYKSRRKPAPKQSQKFIYHNSRRRLHKRFSFDSVNRDKQ